MTSTLAWLVVFLLLFAAGWTYLGVTGRRTPAAEKFVAPARSWSFSRLTALAATAGWLAGWMVLGHPGLVFRDGFPYANVALAAVVIPLAGVLVVKRQWMLGRRFGYVTQGEMLADYFQAPALRAVAVVVAVLFAIPFVAVQLEASGELVRVLSDGRLDRGVGMGAVAAVALVAVGGLRALAPVNAVACVLVALAAAGLGAMVVDAAGGWQALQAAIGRLSASRLAGWDGPGADVSVSYLAVPGVIRHAIGFGPSPTSPGGIWTGLMGLTFLLALVGLQVSPAATAGALAADEPRTFAAQQVWATALGLGAVLVVFAAVQGIGAHLIGGDTSVVRLGLGARHLISEAIARAPDTLVPRYLALVGARMPWLAGLAAAAALITLATVAAMTLASVGTAFKRDLLIAVISPGASNAFQLAVARMGEIIIVVAAMAMVVGSDDALVFRAVLAAAVAVQMLPAVVAATWLPWITRQGATWGLAAGLVAVVLTEPVGLGLLASLGLEPWGRWPWGIHSAGWGLALNLTVCIAVSAMTQGKDEARHRLRFHAFLTQHARISPDRAQLKPLAAIITLAWLFFGVGPGAVIGNDIFGAPSVGPGGWTFAMPSIWAWQVGVWILGVGVIWLLAYKLKMSMVSRQMIEAVERNAGETPEHGGEAMRTGPSRAPS